MLNNKASSVVYQAWAHLKAYAQTCSDLPIMFIRLFWKNSSSLPDYLLLERGSAGYAALKRWYEIGNFPQKTIDLEDEQRSSWVSQGAHWVTTCRQLQLLIYLPHPILPQDRANFNFCARCKEYIANLYCLYIPFKMDWKSGKQPSKRVKDDALF